MIYFDNAATSLPKFKSVAESVSNAILTFGNYGRSSHEPSLLAAKITGETRRKIANMFGLASEECCAFVPSCTYGLNAVIHSLVNENDKVLISCTEHNSVLRPLYDSKADLTIIGINQKANIDLDSLGNNAKKGVAAVFISHASNISGNVADIKKIGEKCSELEIPFIVDASQTAGCIPFDINEAGADIICFSAHKGLKGPLGVGCVLVNQNSRKKFRLKSHVSGGSGFESFSKTQPSIFPDVLEAGSLNTHAIAGLNAAIDEINKLGIQNIYNTEYKLSTLFYDLIKDIKHIKIYGDFDAEIRCPIVSFNIRDYDSQTVADELWQKHNIAARGGSHCSPLMHEALGTIKQGIVRFSFSIFNTEKEIRLAADVVRYLAES